MAFLKPLLFILLNGALIFAQKGKDVTIDLGSVSSSTVSDTTTLQQSDSLILSEPLELNRDSDKFKSVWGASLLNLALPGMGHFYLGDNRKGVAYLSADLLLWTGFFFTMASSNRYEDNAISYAYTYAHTLSSYEYKNSYWGALGNTNFLNNVSYNEALENNRQFDKKYLGDDAWSWDSKENQENYNDIRSDAHAWETASYIVLGALFLNRVVSFIDGRVSAQRFNNAQMKIMPTYSLNQVDKTHTFGAVFRMSF